MCPRRYVTAFCLACAGLFPACGGLIDPSKNEVTMFSGTVAVNGQNFHELVVSRNGELEVKITEMSPNQDAFMGLQYGPLRDQGCLGAFQTNVFAQLNRVALTGLINSGRFCLIIFDVGMLQAPQTYTLSVSHP